MSQQKCDNPLCKHPRKRGDRFCPRCGEMELRKHRAHVAPEFNKIIREIEAEDARRRRNGIRNSWSSRI